MCAGITRQDSDIPHKKKRSKEYLEYQKYIRSKDFDEVKEIVKERDKFCQCCGRTLEEIENSKSLHFNVHHRSYKNLFKGGQEEASDCILLCSVCHKAIHSAKSNLRRFKREKGEPESLQS